MPHDGYNQWHTWAMLLYIKVCLRQSMHSVQSIEKGAENTMWAVHPEAAWHLHASLMKQSGVVRL